jgi:hypothetical protein
MIEKTIQLFSFNELSEKAKEKAMNNYRYNQDYPWYDEAFKSLKGFCDKFDVNIKDYSLGDGSGRDYIMTDAAPSVFDDYDPAMIKKDEFYTGYYMDCTLINGFIEGLKNGSSFEAFNYAIECFISDLNKDVDYFQSDASTTEILIDNDYHFTSDGEMYNL